MQDRKPSSDYPCPFCGSGAILFIGGGRIYLYYRCGDCAEVWTVTDSADALRRYLKLNREPIWVGS